MPPWSHVTQGEKGGVEEGCKAPFLTRACHTGCASTPQHHSLQGGPGEVPAQQDTAEQELGGGIPRKAGIPEVPCLRKHGAAPTCWGGIYILRSLQWSKDNPTSILGLKAKGCI